MRDLVSFLLGLGMVIDQVWLSRSANTTLILAGLALMGLPVALGIDEKKKQ